jgi:hypothetical protein
VSWRELHLLDVVFDQILRAQHQLDRDGLWSVEDEQIKHPTEERAAEKENERKKQKDGERIYAALVGRCDIPIELHFPV